MRFSVFAIAVVLFFPLIDALAGEGPFDPVFAADQKIISTSTMESEMHQFRSISRWNASAARLNTAERKRDQAKVELDRVQQLFDKGQTPESNLNLAKFEYQNSVDRVTQMNNLLQHSKYDAIISRLKILEEGNPGVDHRQKIAEASLEATKIELSNLFKNREAASSSSSYYETRLKNGRILREKGIISKADLERREMEYLNSIDQLKALDFEIQASKDAIKGLEGSLIRLKSE